MQHAKQISPPDGLPVHYCCGWPGHPITVAAVIRDIVHDLSLISVAIRSDERIAFGLGAMPHELDLLQ